MYSCAQLCGFHTVTGWAVARTCYMSRMAKYIVRAEIKQRHEVRREHDGYTHKLWLLCASSQSFKPDGNIDYWCNKEYNELM